MIQPSEGAVREALFSVEEPAFGRSIVELGLVDRIRIDGQKLYLAVQISVPTDSFRTQVERAIGEAVRPLGLSSVEIEWELRVTARQMMGEDPMPNVKNVVLVMSGKGGVGKSTCSANLALALARDGAQVGLLDADIYGPSVPTMMGVSESPASNDGVSIEPIERHGIKLMSIGFMLEDPRAAIIWRGPRLHSLLQQFLADVRWGELDYLLMDLPPGTGDVALTLAQRMRVTGAVIVTTPQEVALQDVYKSVSMCQKLGIPILGVLENMSYFIDSAGVKHELFGQGGGSKVAEFARAPLLGQIPIDTLVREWGDGGTPVVKAVPGAPIGEVFIRVADTLARLIAKSHFQAAGGDKAPPSKGPSRLKIVR